MSRRYRKFSLARSHFRHALSQPPADATDKTKATPTALLFTHGLDSTGFHKAGGSLGTEFSSETGK